MDSAKSVTATFAKNNAILTENKVGTGSGTISGNTTTYVTGSTATITAIPAAGSTFTSWTGCTAVSGDTCTVSMS